MAEIVAAVGVPHDPDFPSQVAKEGPNSEVATLYREVARHLEAVAPDVVVVFDSDHLNTFFLNNLPTFSVGIGERTAGPNDDTAMPRYTVGLDDALARHIRTSGINAGFDLALAQAFELDHSVMVPLHFLTPAMRIPIVPVFVNGLAPPVPSARRCAALGECVRRAIDAWPEDRRVAILASGGFSLEVGGPKIEPGRLHSVPKPDWAARVTDLLVHGRVDDLLNEATTDRITDAGNAAGELLNWIAMLGAIGDRRPRFLEPRVEAGHAYGAWRWD